MPVTELGRPAGRDTHARTAFYPASARLRITPWTKGRKGELKRDIEAVVRTGKLDIVCTAGWVLPLNRLNGSLTCNLYHCSAYPIHYTHMGTNDAKRALNYSRQRRIAIFFCTNTTN